MIRDIIFKKDFSPVKKNGNVFHLMWGAKDMGDHYICNHEIVSVNNVNIIDIVERGVKKGYPTISNNELKNWLNVLGNNSINVEWLREKIHQDLIKYDKSEKVNMFTINGINLWLDSDLRYKVFENLESSEKEGLTKTTLRINGMSFNVTVEEGWAMYYAVLSYARKCWNVTEDHHTAINKITDIEGLLAYDFTSGYPAKLSF